MIAAKLPKGARLVVEEKRRIEFSFQVSARDYEDVVAAWFSKDDKPLKPAEFIMDGISAYESELERYPEALADQRGCIVRHRRDSEQDPQKEILVTFTDEQYQKLVSFSKLYRISFKKSVASLFADDAAVAREELQKEALEEQWLERKAHLPTTFRYHVLKLEQAGRTGSDTYLSLRKGDYWPKFQARRKGHPPYAAKLNTKDRTKVVITISLPSKHLKRLEKKGYGLEHIIRGMTSWGRDESPRPDYQTAWFGHPSELNCCGMLLIADSFKHEPHRSVEFEIPVTLWDGVMNASNLVGASREAWIYGCITGFDEDSHGVMGRASLEIHNAARWTEALLKGGGQKK